MVQIKEETNPELIASLDRACFAQGWPASDFTPHPSRHALAAWSGGLPVGFVWVQLVQSEMEILRIGTLPSCRRTGIGGLLLQALQKNRPWTEANGNAHEQQAGAADASIYLEVEQNNTAARALYRKHGFQAGPLRLNYYGPGRHALTMFWTQPGAADST